jgi:hypothetical protein
VVDILLLYAFYTLNSSPATTQDKTEERKQEEEMERNMYHITASQMETIMEQGMTKEIL